MSEHGSDGNYEAPKAEQLDTGGRPLETSAGFTF